MARTPVSRLVLVVLVVVVVLLLHAVQGRREAEEGQRRPDFQDDERLTYHQRRPHPSKEALAKYIVPRITDADFLHEVEYGPFVYYVLIYGDNTRSRETLKLWYAAAQELAGRLKFAQLDASGTRFEQLASGKIGEAPLPSLYRFDDLGKSHAKGRIVTTTFPSSKEEMVALLTNDADQHIPLAADEANLAPGQGLLKHGGSYTPNQDVDDL